MASYRQDAGTGQGQKTRKKREKKGTTGGEVERGDRIPEKEENHGATTSGSI